MVAAPSRRLLAEALVRGPYAVVLLSALARVAPRAVLRAAGHHGGEAVQFGLSARSSEVRPAQLCEGGLLVD
ncbi:hypothetical protein [Nonomuraea jabiensis]|uniref:Uncharacterized protein n=1 Tax=Nonomuraea jabiensis TaxID=882448 RepID=A0A7W9LHW3_9ACTN|nr:hypothetical protein [Nonomuraea jabiensis]MBB5784377.1 hypothetical protein [Nonomuraea jabiensis]